MQDQKPVNTEKTNTQRNDKPKSLLVENVNPNEVQPILFLELEEPMKIGFYKMPLAENS